jgi:predicted  nucleic acid-binding Zn-ribbon protein
MTAMLWIDSATFRRCSDRVFWDDYDIHDQQAIKKNKSAGSAKNKTEVVAGTGRDRLEERFDSVSIHEDGALYVNGGATNG